MGNAGTYRTHTAQQNQPNYVLCYRWMFEASEAIQLLASHLHDLEDLLHGFISRLNPQYGLDILDREEELTQEVDFLKEEIERAQKDGEGWRQISIDAVWKQDRADESAQKLRRVVSFVQSELEANGEVVLALIIAKYASGDQLV